MLLTFLRTQIGTDETVFLRFLLSRQVAFVNVDDTTFSNFNATSLHARLARRVVRRTMMGEMALHVRHICSAYGVSRVFIFNGRGIDRRTIQALPANIPIVWLNPDSHRHAEHRYLEEVATRILLTKPESFNFIRFPHSVTREKVVNIAPVLFADRSEKAGKLGSALWSGPDERDIPMVFLGNYSVFKGTMLEEISTHVGLPVTVIGSGWRESRGILPIGPIFGHAISRILSRSKVAIALPDVVDGEMDPITVRYFQYPLLGAPAVYYVNDYNRSLLAELSDFCFENLPEAALRIRHILSLGPQEYRTICCRQASFVNVTASSVEDILERYELV
jgi:hypothetical protein